MSKYCSKRVRNEIKQGIKRAGINYIELGDKLGYDESTVRKWFNKNRLTITNANKIIEVLNPILKDKGQLLIEITGEGGRLYDADTKRVSKIMSKSLAQLTRHLDAADMRTLETVAWKMYRAKYPTKPAFYDYTPPAKTAYPPIATRWDSLTDKQKEEAIRLYDDARVKAEAKIANHVKAEKLHEEAAAISGSIWIEEAQSNVQAWINGCPPGKKYDQDRRCLEMKNEQLKMEKEEAAKDN